MNELELDIGRKFGASCFYIYMFVRHNPNCTSIDIETETGLSSACIRTNLLKLEETSAIEGTLKLGHSRLRVFKEKGAHIIEEITRHKNRKLWSKTESKLMSLDKIRDLLKEGRKIRVTNFDGTDITARILKKAQTGKSRVKVQEVRKTWMIH